VTNSLKHTLILVDNSNIFDKIIIINNTMILLNKTYIPAVPYEGND